MLLRSSPHKSLRFFHVSDYCALQINIQDHEKFRFLSQKNEEALKQEQLAASERQKASKALAEIEGCQAL
jgi:hypothetical protein